MNGRRPQDLADWLRANRSAYTREALDRAAAEQGWSPDDIAAAWRLVEGSQTMTSWTQGAGRMATASDVRTQQILLLVLLAPMAALALLFEFALGPVAGALPVTPGLVLGMGLTIAIPIVAFAVVSRSSLPMGCLGLIGFVLIVEVAIFGACLLTLNLTSTLASATP